MANHYDLDADEVIITSSDSLVCVIDPKTGKQLKSYKCPKISSKCLALLAHDYFIGAPSSVPDIKIWPVRDETSMVSSPCGTVNALAVTHCGKFCVAAFKQEIRIWDVQTGEMLSRFARHYQDVTCLKFTSDDSMLLSGSKDGNVLVFNFESLCSVKADPQLVKPLYTWNNHASEVTDIYLSELGILSRVATTSKDMTCKIYELDSGLLLTTLCLDVPLTAVTMDSLEYHVIIGTSEGTILKVNLYDDQPREAHRNTLENEEVQGHSCAISGLSCSLMGDKFLSTAIKDKVVKVWEVASLAYILAVNCGDGLITNAFFTQYPSPLLTKANKYFNVSQLDRDFLTPQERFLRGANKAIKVHSRPLSLIHVSGIDKAYSPAVLSGKIHAPAVTATEAFQTENIFQEVYRGETINEVRDVNAQLFTYMVENVFKRESSISSESQIEQMEDC